jgi:hypothetical protein
VVHPAWALTIGGERSASVLGSRKRSQKQGCHRSNIDPDGKDKLPTLGFKIDNLINKFSDNDDLNIFIEFKDYKINFKISIGCLKEYIYHIPFLLLPTELLSNNNYKIKSFYLIFKDKKYILAWNIIHQYNQDYIIINPVNIFISDLKIYKKPSKTYKITCFNKVYEIICQCLEVDKVKICFIPEFLIPRRKFPAYVYIYIGLSYIFSKKSLSEVSKEAEKAFGIEINPSTVSRTAKALFDSFLEVFHQGQPVGSVVEPSRELDDRTLIDPAKPYFGLSWTGKGGAAARRADAKATNQVAVVLEGLGLDVVAVVAAAGWKFVTASCRFFMRKIFSIGALFNKSCKGKLCYLP